MRLAAGLIVALAALLASGWAIAGQLGWAWLPRSLAAIGFVLLFGALISAAGQAVASALDRSPQRSRGGAAIQVYLRELGHFYWCFLIAQSLLAWFMPRRRTPENARAVAVFAHGFLCNRGLWWCWRQAWHRAGFETVVLDLPPGYWFVKTNQQRLQQALEEAAARHPQLPLCVVGHSMGGFIARMHLLQRQPQLAAVVCLGAPHRGTQLAGQMGGEEHGPPTLTSPWLVELNRLLPPQAHPLALNLWSANDCIVVPASSSALDDSTDRTFHGYGHMGLCQAAPLCAEVLKEVQQRLEGAAAKRADLQVADGAQSYLKDRQGA